MSLKKSYNDSSQAFGGIRTPSSRRATRRYAVLQRGEPVPPQAFPELVLTVDDLLG